MTSAFNKALLVHIINASLKYDPRERRFYYAVAIALALLLVAVLMVVFLF